ncbi:Cysteine-rich repeat secretory protein 38 [Striga hermonthica]|uniref:Cysteine-rich repeat secretory protein 38 n=1 Tax=Striga hermonthica TaxID=68872 RepID=A0A9N7NI94_STRHE|nr:Cysteine-rich repeat secretory protein 38 [Striga hermonthica]
MSTTSSSSSSLSSSSICPQGQIGHTWVQLPHTNTCTGIALCRRDISGKECTNCLYKARDELTKNCKTRVAIVWHDHCYLKYADYYFLGAAYTYNYYYTLNKNNVNVDPIGFYATVMQLISKLNRQANQTDMLFAKGKVPWKESSVTIHGMVLAAGIFLNSNAHVNVCLTCYRILRGTWSTTTQLLVQSVERFSPGVAFGSGVVWRTLGLCGGTLMEQDLADKLNKFRLSEKEESGVDLVDEDVARGL